MSKPIAEWIEELGSTDKRIRAEAVRALAYVGADAIEPIFEALHQEVVDLKTVADVLGQIGEPAFVHLADWLGNNDPKQQIMAAQIFALINDPYAVLPLVMALSSPDDSVRIAVAEALSSFSDPRATSPLIETLQDKNEQVRARAATALGGHSRDPRVPKALIESANDPEPIVRSGVARGMAYINDPRIRAKLQTMTEDVDDNVRQLAAAALQHLDGDRMVFERMRAHTSTANIEEFLSQALADQHIDDDEVDAMRNSNPRVRAQMMEMIGTHGAENAIKLLVPGLNDINPAVRKTAIDTIIRLGENAVPHLLPVLESPSRYVRAGAAEALLRIDADIFFEHAPKLAKDDSIEVRLQIVRALPLVTDAEKTINLLKILQKDDEKEVRDLALQQLEQRGYVAQNPVSRFFKKFLGSD